MVSELLWRIDYIIEKGQLQSKTIISIFIVAHSLQGAMNKLKAHYSKSGNVIRLEQAEQVGKQEVWY